MAILSSKCFKSLNVSKKFLKVLCFDDVNARKTRRNNKLGYSSDIFETYCFLQDGYVPDSHNTDNDQV